MKTMTRVLIVLLAAYCGSAAAEVYRWVDAKGGVHYSDRPDSDQAQPVGIYSRPTNREAVAQRTSSEREQRAQVAAQEQEQEATEAVSNAVNRDVSAVRAEQCKKAQEQYKVAIESQRLYRMGKDGERVYLNDAELSEARVNARKAMDNACNPKS
jgi:hypothetical protein